MKIFIIHSERDGQAIHKAIQLLKKSHDILNESPVAQADYDSEAMFSKHIANADALIVVVSDNFYQDSIIQSELSSLFLHELFLAGNLRIAVINLDQSPIPSLLLGRHFFDLSGKHYDKNVSRLSHWLEADRQGGKIRSRLPQWLPSLPDPLAKPTDTQVTSDTIRKSQIRRLHDLLREGRLTLVCGAGISIDVGIPGWDKLLMRLLAVLMDRLRENTGLTLDQQAHQRFKEAHGVSPLIIAKYFKNNLKDDFQAAVRSAIYASTNGVAASPLMDSIVELCRPQRAVGSLNSIITFNFDEIIEERLRENNVRYKPIYSNAMDHKVDEMPIYHVHGFLPRDGDIPADMEIVFSEDAYHSIFVESFSWSNLIQLNKLTQSTCLLIGVSLTDPNMRRLLDIAFRMHKPIKSPPHFIIKRLPSASGGDSIGAVARHLEEQDANLLGLNVIWIDSFEEQPQLLRDIASGIDA